MTWFATVRNGPVLANVAQAMHVDRIRTPFDSTKRSMILYVPLQLELLSSWNADERGRCGGRGRQGAE